MTTYNTGTTADNNTGSPLATQAITIPAGILGGDVVFICATNVNLIATPAAMSAASTGTTPVQAGTTGTGTEPLPASVATAVWYFTAAGTFGSASSDVGKVVTITATSTSTGFISAALAAYSGASNSSPVDVVGNAFGGAGVASVTCPSKVTGVAGDWAVYFGSGAAEGGGLAGPSGATMRQSVMSGADVGVAVYDSNGSAGAAGSTIGGGTFTTSSATNSILVAFTLGLAPPAAATAGRPLVVSQAVNRAAYY